MQATERAARRSDASVWYQIVSFPPLYILRHGQTVWNAEKRIQGGLDSPLTALGRAQAAQQHQILARRDLSGFDAVSSPQGRAVTTAEIALAGLCPTLRQDAALAEIGVGSWEGLLRSELPVSSPADESEENALALYDKAPGGEGLAGLRLRCEAFLSRVTTPSVLVTHGITSRMLRLVLTAQSLDQIADVGGGQGVVFFVQGGRQTKLSIGA